MKKIYLLRHCEYSNPRNILVGRLPVELSQDGIEKAEKLADYFVDKKIEKIYSSAVRRCQQTSEIVSKGNIPIEFDQRLLEVLSAYQGFWPSENGEMDWSHFYRHRQELGGESWEDISNRVLNFFNEVVLKEEGNIIICSHGDPLFVLFLQLIGECEDLSDLRLYGEEETYTPKGSFREISWIDQDNYEVSEIQNV